MTSDDVMRKVREYAFATRNGTVSQQDAAYRDVEVAVESIIADRDTLAAGVRDAHIRDYTISTNVPTFRDALEATRRLKAASEPATVPAAAPAATATGEAKPPEPEPVKPPAMRVWYENGRYFVECEGSVLSLGPKHKDPSAYAIYVPGPATGGPKSAEHAEPAKPSPLAAGITSEHEEAIASAKHEAVAKPEYDLVVVTNNKINVWRYRRGRVLGETTLLRQPLNWRSAEATRDSWYGIKTGYRMFSSWTEAEKWIAGEAEPPAVPAATAEPASAVAVADQATEEWRQRDAEDRATQPEPAKPEPTDLRTLVEGMKHRVDAAIGSLIGAARDKNLLTIDALRAIARVVEELAKEAKP
jgi:hypothetical protein